MSFIRKEDWVQALGGGQGGLAAILVTLPIESVQKMQGISKGKAPSITECIRTIYRSGGLPEFYRGISPLVIQCFVEKFGAGRFACLPAPASQPHSVSSC
eukprot:COSAG01_NODE_300_length_19226_cov_41.536519_27_plen_100_part_00